MAEPLVSILIAAYNAERWLAASIESALRQTHPRIEVIVVDDGSTDGTLDLAHAFESCGVRVFHQPHAGACVARNRALMEARAGYVKFLDADDVLTPDAVAVQVRALELHPGGPHVVPFGDLAVVGQDLEPGPSSPPAPPVPDAVGSDDLVTRVTALLAHNIQTSLPLHRREALLRAGGFRPHLKKEQEYDLHVRLALSGARFVHVAHTTTLYRVHGAPTRIANTAPLLTSPECLLRGRIDLRETLEGALGHPLPEPVRGVLAGRTWSQARRLIRDGQEGVGLRYFEEALLLDPDMRHAGIAYRALSRLLGPVRGESALQRVRTTLGRS